MIEEKSLFYIIAEVLSLISQKNQRYGSSYKKTREKYGEIAFLIRIEDKLNRLETLMRNKEIKDNEESIEDTIKDLMGYCLLELYYRKEGE